LKWHFYWSSFDYSLPVFEMIVSLSILRPFSSIEAPKIKRKLRKFFKNIQRILEKFNYIAIIIAFSTLILTNFLWLVFVWLLRSQFMLLTAACILPKMRF
jgi:hypothetical protein